MRWPLRHSAPEENLRDLAPIDRQLRLLRAFGFVTYPSGALSKTSSHPVRARLGMSGLFTPSFGILAMVGWGASFYNILITGQDKSTVQDFNSVLAQAELRWYLQKAATTDPLKVNPLLSAIAVEVNSAARGKEMNADTLSVIAESSRKSTPIMGEKHRGTTAITADARACAHESSAPPF